MSCKFVFLWWHNLGGNLPIQTWVDILKQKPSSLTTFPEIYLGTFLMFLSITFIMFFDRLFGIKHNSQMMSCPDLTMWNLWAYYFPQVLLLILIYLSFNSLRVDGGSGDHKDQFESLVWIAISFWWVTLIKKKRWALSPLCLHLCSHIDGSSLLIAWAPVAEGRTFSFVLPTPWQIKK